MHGLAVYVKEGLPFARDLSLESFAGGTGVEFLLSVGKIFFRRSMILVGDFY